MAPADDRDLARRAASGDRHAFSELVRRHQSVVYNVAYRLLGERGEAQDAAQETFLRAYRYLASYDPDKPLAPWLKRIATNLCYDRLKQAPSTPSLDEEAVRPPPDPQPGPEAQTIQRERGERVHQEMLLLPPRYRVVIELRHFQNLSYAEMAEALKRPLSDVKSDLFRARKRLAERLKDLQ
jgi:RNA polymerase sigma-70 factor (ECF subfamily)